MRERCGVRGLIPPLGRRAWWLFFGYTLQKLGYGFTSPFLIIYLHDVRGMDLGTAGLVLATSSAGGMLAVAAVGGLTDRIGAGRTLVLSLVAGAVGVTVYAAVQAPWAAFLAAALDGAGMAGMWSAFSSLLAVAVPPAQRSGAFAVSFLLLNLGIGLGAATGGLVVNVHSLASFQLMFLLNAAGSLLLAALVVALGEARHSAAAPRPAPRATAGGDATGYRAVLKDRALVAVTAVNTLIAFVTVAYFSTAFPAWVTGPAGASTRVVGLATTANTALIVFGQLFVLRYLLEGRRRTRAMAVAGLIYGAAILLTLSAGAARGGALTAAVPIAAMAIYGLGETLLQPSIFAMVNDLAPDAMRGRYNAVFNLSWQVGPIMGPAVVGAMLNHGLYTAVFVGMAAMCGLIALLALGLERLIPARANLGHRPDRSAPRTGPICQRKAGNGKSE
jgi:MFS family permease